MKKPERDDKALAGAKPPADASDVVMKARVCRVDAFAGDLAKALPDDMREVLCGPSGDPKHMVRTVVLAAINAKAEIAEANQDNSGASKKYGSISVAEFRKRLARAQAALRALNECGPLFYMPNVMIRRNAGPDAEIADAQDYHFGQSAICEAIEETRELIARQVAVSKNLAKDRQFVRDLSQHAAIVGATGMLTAFWANSDRSTNIDWLAFLEAALADAGLPDHSSPEETNREWLRKYLKRHNLFRKLITSK